MDEINGLLRNILGGIFAAGLMVAGVYHRAKRQALNEHGILPLFFHTVSKRFFLACIRWLKSNGYSFISTAQLIDHLRGKETIPERAVWLTFDDGWKENIENVIPIIIEYNIPVTFFISTDPVENSGIFWWSYVMKYGKYLSADVTIKKLRRVSESRRGELIKQLEDRFASRMEREAMSIEQVKQISRLPQVTVGCHTVHHVMMPKCDEQELEYEIKTSKEKLENWSGKKVTYFSYPEGDYNQRVIEIVKKHGFDLAATTDNRFISNSDDLFSLPRFWVRGQGFFIEAKCQMLGIWVPLMGKIQQMFRDWNLTNMIKTKSPQL